MYRIAFEFDEGSGITRHEYTVTTEGYAAKRGELMERFKHFLVTVGFVFPAEEDRQLGLPFYGEEES